VTDVRESALAYAGRGLLVLPLAWPTDVGECSCGCADRRCWERAKHPLVRLRDASCDPATIARWWQRWPHANVGIAPWRSGLVVVDLDLRPGRGDLLGSFLDAWGPESLETVVATTGKGYHLYYRRAPSAPRLFGGKDRLARGTDVITDGYVVAPPSIHHSLQSYGWRRGASLAIEEPAELPPTLAAALQRRPSIAWYAHNAPYSVASMLHLSFGTRATLRRVAKRMGIEP
jgi:Bifunctional DNA primase/polymerase, N-terminal